MRRRTVTRGCIGCVALVALIVVLTGSASRLFDDIPDDRLPADDRLESNRHESHSIESQEKKSQEDGAERAQGEGSQHEPLSETKATDGSFGGTTSVSSFAAPLLSAAETYSYFSNILVIMMMSPARYHLVKNVHDHYRPFFKHMTFCGPKTADVMGIHIQGYDIVYGNEQYRAVSRIIRHNLNGNTSSTFEGFLYLSDDVQLQPWSIAAKRFNRAIPWATQMGIANLANGRPVAAVPGMSIQSKYRAQWPYWAKNRKKLMGVLEEGGASFREAMYQSAKATHPLIFKWSKYSGKHMTEELLHNVIFYTIVDTYYIPRRLGLRYADACDLMAKHWVFGECAIATAIRSLSPIYETMDVQFYWSTLNAADCHRYKWRVMIDGFHRCRHDHHFSHLLYHSDEVRNLLKNNQTYLKDALLLNGLVDVPTDVPLVLSPP